MVRRARLIMLGLWAATFATPAWGQSARIKAVVDGVSPTRIKADLVALTALETRFALSPEFWRATEFVRARLAAAGLTPELDPFNAGPARVNNIIVTLKGSLPDRPLILSSAHYDSITFDPGPRSPGAEDNASGTAGLLELARVLRGQRLATGVRLIFFAAEEEGVWGSKHLVQKYAQSGELYDLTALINMDMIGHDPHKKRAMVVDTFPVSRALAGRVQAAAAMFTSLLVYVDVRATGRSDHRPFVEAGLPAVNLATASWRDYTAYHSARDTVDQVDPEMVAEVTRANLATILRLAGFEDGPPVAHGGDHQEAEVGHRVALDGRGSFDPQGEDLTYAWRQIGGQPVQLAGSSGSPSFIAQAPGGYRFELKVTSKDGRTSEPDLVGGLVEDVGGCAVGGAGPSRVWIFVLILWWGWRSGARSPGAGKPGNCARGPLRGGRNRGVVDTRR